MSCTCLSVPTGRDAWSVLAPPGQDRGDGLRDFVLLLTGVASLIPISVLHLLTEFSVRPLLLSRVSVV
jgi:hypothetical protein